MSSAYGTASCTGRRAFRMAGSGPALLLIHGIGDSSRTWLELLPRLAERFTVIAPDLLGHGGSAKPRADYAAAAYACGMRDLLSLLDIDSATVVGHSLGGGVAMQFAYQYPDRFVEFLRTSTRGLLPPGTSRGSGARYWTPARRTGRPPRASGEQPRPTARPSGN